MASRPVIYASVVLSLPATTSSFYEKRLSEKTEKSIISDLISEKQGMGSESSKQTNSPLTVKVAFAEKLV